MKSFTIFIFLIISTGIVFYYIKTHRNLNTELRVNSHENLVAGQVYNIK